MDKSFGSRAYCLSCYYQFPISQKVEIRSVKSKDYSGEMSRYLKKAVEDIKRIKNKINKIEGVVLSLVEEHNLKSEEIPHVVD